MEHITQEDIHRLFQSETKEHSALSFSDSRICTHPTYLCSLKKNSAFAGHNEELIFHNIKILRELLKFKKKKKNVDIFPLDMIEGKEMTRFPLL